MNTADLYVQPGPPLADSDLPAVTVVVLNWNGRRHLEGCFESLKAMPYPAGRLDVVLVDNASDDGSVAEVRSRWPWVRVHVNDRNEGFARGCNRGASLRSGSSIVAFVNNDIRVDARWLAELVQPIVRGEAVATTSKMLSWDGSRIDSAGGGMNFHGMGLQYGYKDVPASEHDRPRRTLFPCGGAMAIDAAVFEACGGFDPEFFAYYEDVDLGWRLWVQGHEVRYVPTSVCWHHHHGTSAHLPIKTVRLIQVRNPLYACFKNYDDAHLRQVLPVALALLLRRASLMSGIEGDSSFRIEHARPSAGTQQPGWLERVWSRLSGRRRSLYGETTMSSIAAADLLAANDLLSRWPHWMNRRTEVQAKRKRADEEIFTLFLRPLWCIEGDEAYRRLFAGSTEFFGVAALFEGRAVMAEDPRH
ncbi:MAG TPA: glycosyltransferase family 2 protein [Vicinamibacterales bacterium]|nr:glycosyltransferase family 2 protein [Vicinamibacterales bacterium]